jgi:hypothetical protein
MVFAQVTLLVGVESRTVCEDKHSLLDVFMDTIKPVFRDLAMLRGGHTEVWGL